MGRCLEGTQNRDGKVAVSNDESNVRLPVLLGPVIQRSLMVASWIGIITLWIASDWRDWQREPKPERQGEPAGLGEAPSPLRIDLNTADKRELTLMPGIGSLTAARILDDRSAHGPFRSIEDLQRVPGVGPKTVREIKPYCLPISVKGPDVARLKHVP